MASFLIVIGLIFIGFIVGGLLNTSLGKLEKHKLGILGESGLNTLYFIVEIAYLSLIFSIPLSGNIPLFILIVAVFLYALYGSFGREKLKPRKPEDRVITKWFSGYP